MPNVSNICSQQKLTVLKEVKMEAGITVPLELPRPQSKLPQSHGFNSLGVMCNLCWCNKRRIILIFTIKFNIFLKLQQPKADSQRGSKKHYTDNFKRSYKNTYVVNELHSASHVLCQHDEYLDREY